MRVTRKDLTSFVGNELTSEELGDLAGILKCRKESGDPGLPKEIVKQLYWQYQTPLGFAARTPTLDTMCDKIAKRLKLRKLAGAGWSRLYSLSICVFEKVLKSLPEEEKRGLLKELWNRLDDDQHKQLMNQFHIGDFNALFHASEITAAHVFGVFLARQMTLYTAASLLAAFASSQAALVTSRILSRGVAVALGPIGWGLLGLSANDFMGTRLKTVVPALLILNAARLRTYPPEQMSFL
ncbi:hypothetical protein ACFL1X_02430 [Candidatus Hydrogenedentota bacterium]